MLRKLLKYEWMGLRFPLMIMMIVLAGTMVLTCCVILTNNPKHDPTIAWYTAMELMLSFFLYYFSILKRNSRFYDYIKECILKRRIKVKIMNHSGTLKTKLSKRELDHARLARKASAEGMVL